MKSVTPFVLPQNNNYNNPNTNINHHGLLEHFKNVNINKRTINNVQISNQERVTCTFFKKGLLLNREGGLCRKSKRDDNDDKGGKGRDGDGDGDGEKAVTVTKVNADADVGPNADANANANADPKKKEGRKEVNETKRDVSFQAFKLFSYVIQFLGLYFSFGLLLNILGYGYSFDFQSGFRVDKIENLRNEMQFRREIERSTTTTTTTGTTSVRSATPSVSEVLDDNINPSSSLPR